MPLQAKLLWLFAYLFVVTGAGMLGAGLVLGIFFEQDYPGSLAWWLWAIYTIMFSGVGGMLLYAGLYSMSELKVQKLQAELKAKT